MIGNHVDPLFHLLICLIQSDNIGRNGGGTGFLVRREPSGKNAQNSSLVFLEGCFNSTLTVKLHIYSIEASNSKTGPGWDVAQEPSFQMLVLLESTEERQSCWEEWATPEGPGRSHCSCFWTFHYHHHLGKAIMDVALLGLHCWVFNLLPSFISLCIFMSLGKEHRMRSQVLSLEASK